jgi:hypothetical protein
VPLEQVHDDRAVDDQHRRGQQETGEVPAPEHVPSAAGFHAAELFVTDDTGVCRPCS